MEGALSDRLFILFRDPAKPGDPPYRAVGPYRIVRPSGTAVWAYDPSEITVPVRIATQGDDLLWELDGFPEDPRFGSFEVFAVNFDCSAADVERSVTNPHRRVTT